jgi:hypothetical protein
LLKKKPKIPIGQLIDKLYNQDQAIDTIEAELRDAKKKREAIQARLLKNLSTAALDGAKGKLATATVKTNSYPSIKNRPKFIKYVIANKAWDLFQNRIAAKAYTDRTEDGEYIPGIEIFNKIRVNVRRRV